jgi:hypothetical protein
MLDGRDWPGCSIRRSGLLVTSTSADDDLQTGT